jgi:ABC-type sugar transport system substrate-binding protein
MKRKSLALVLAVLLMIGVATACGTSAQSPSESSSQSPSESSSQSQESQTAPATDLKVGYLFMEMNDPTYISTFMNQELVYEKAGIGIVKETITGLDPEGMVNGYQKLIDSGVDAIELMGMSQAIVPIVQEMCEKAGVYFVITAREIYDPNVLEKLEGSEYYLGNFYADEENTGYMGMKKMAELETKNVCVIAGPVGDPASDARDRGIDKAIQETGLNILTTVRELNTAADITKAVESMVAAFPDMDGIFVSYTWAAGAMPALQKVLETAELAGKVKVGRIDFDTTMSEYFDKSQLSFTYGAQMHLGAVAAPVVIANQLMGTPLSDEPIIYATPYEMRTSSEGTAEYYKYFEGEIPVYTEDELNELFFKFKNPDVTAESVMELFKAFCIADVAERHKDLG